MWNWELSDVYSEERMAVKLIVLTANLINIFDEVRH